MQWNLKLGQWPTQRDLYKIYRGESRQIIDHRSDPPKPKPKPKSKK